MRQFIELLRRILTEGVRKEDRTKIGTLSLFGHQLRFDLAQGFPLITTKKIHLPAVIYELLWFLRGDTNVAWLREHGVTIWDEWADERGELGPVYGRQWRAWGAADGRTIDQIMLAQQGDLTPGELVWTGGDCHLYLNHLEQADLQLSRTPYPLPRLTLRRRPPSMFEYRFEDFEFVDYRHHATIRAPVAV